MKGRGKYNKIESLAKCKEIAVRRFLDKKYENLFKKLPVRQIRLWFAGQ